jgi:N-carbamoyl-L-amino-acid hydrolase
VVSALAAVEVLRDRGFRPARPIGISVFVEEEGSRFGLACLGSRLATGATSWAEARGLRDRDGVRLDEAMGTAGLDVEDPQAWLRPERLACFVELHVEQGRELVDRGAAVGVASRIWPHGRYRFDIAGEPNHAGTTRMEDRRDPMLTYAMTALAANKQARVAGQRATFGRLDTRPNSTNSVPSEVTAWLDARCETDEALAELVEAITRQASDRAQRDGTSLTITAESVSAAVDFDAGLARRIALDHEAGDWPVLPTQAGHDAGILSAQGIASAMLFVRNPSGVSHSPAEHAEMPDCLAGVDALAETLERVAS